MIHACQELYGIIVFSNISQGFRKLASPTVTMFVLFSDIFCRLVRNMFAYSSRKKWHQTWNHHLCHSRNCRRRQIFRRDHQESKKNFWKNHDFFRAKCIIRKGTIRSKKMSWMIRINKSTCRLCQHIMQKREVAVIHCTTKWGLHCRQCWRSSGAHWTHILSTWSERWDKHSSEDAHDLSEVFVLHEESFVVSKFGVCSCRRQHVAVVEICSPR